MTRVLVVDNDDSFVHTLDGYLRRLGAATEVVRNDDPRLVDAPAALADWDAVLLSPGPGTPAAAGASVPILHAALDTGVPLLGVCLGHQVIAEALGATVTHADELVHGKTSTVVHDGDPLFAGIPTPFRATRYHSLAVVDGTVPDDLEVIARTTGGVIMGVRHRAAPVVGVQFHPESVLTEGGHRLLGNWLESAGLAGAAARGASIRP